MILMLQQGQSPDINKTENMWLRPEKFKSPLKSTLNYINLISWFLAKLSLNLIRQLYSTVPTRLQEVIRI